MSSTCPQCVYTCVHSFVPLHTSEWAYDQRFCYFPKDNFILGHPVDYIINWNPFSHIINYLPLLHKWWCYYLSWWQIIDDWGMSIEWPNSARFSLLRIWTSGNNNVSFSAWVIKCLFLTPGLLRKCWDTVLENCRWGRWWRLRRGGPPWSCPSGGWSSPCCEGLCD